MTATEGSRQQAEGSRQQEAQRALMERRGNVLWAISSKTTAQRELPTAFCLLPSAFCLLPTVFLTPSRPRPYIKFRPLADVAELVDAQVSEACDREIVVVRVHSSALTSQTKGRANCARPLFFQARCFGFTSCWM